MLPILTLRGSFTIGLAESGQEALLLGLCLRGFVIELHVVKAIVTDWLGPLKCAAVQRGSRKLEGPRI